MYISQALFECCCAYPCIEQLLVNAALQFTQLAKKIAELETAEAQRNAQLQPLIAGNHDSRGWGPLTLPEGNGTLDCVSAAVDFNAANQSALCSL